MQQEKKKPTERPRESNYARKVRLAREATARKPPDEVTAEGSQVDFAPLPQTVLETGVIFHVKPDQPYVLLRTAEDKIIYLAKDTVPPGLRDSLRLHAQVVGDVSTVQTHSHSLRRHPPMIRVREVLSPT